MLIIGNFPDLNDLVSLKVRVYYMYLFTLHDQPVFEKVEKES